MRFHLEATPSELWTKGEALLAELAKAFSGINPDLAEVLEKALPPKEQDLKYPALRGLKAITTKEYEATLKRMLADVGKVLDQSVSGTSAGSTVLTKAEPFKKQEDEEEPLEPGDVDPETGDLIPEPEEEEEEEEEEEKSLDKADSSQSEPLQHDFTKPIADKDNRAYERVKKVLKNYGYSDADFEDGGELYGMSVNELIDLVREKKAG